MVVYSTSVVGLPVSPESGSVVVSVSVSGLGSDEGEPVTGLLFSPSPEHAYIQSNGDKKRDSISLSRFSLRLGLIREAHYAII